jgi:hypothetical protein
MPQSHSRRSVLSTLDEISFARRLPDYPVQADRLRVEESDRRNVQLPRRDSTVGVAPAIDADHVLLFTCVWGGIQCSFVRRTGFSTLPRPGNLHVAFMPDIVKDEGRSARIVSNNLVHRSEVPMSACIR